jgi:hypothetical protein
MKKLTFIMILGLAIGLAFYTVETNAQMGSGMMGRGFGSWNGMGSGMMGNGITGGGQMGRGMGSGMGNPGYGNEYGPQYGRQYGPQYQQPQKPLEEKDARTILRNYLNGTRNPNLKLGKIEDKGNAFQGEILTKNNSLVDKILVDKNTGRTRSVY